MAPSGSDLALLSAEMLPAGPFRSQKRMARFLGITSGTFRALRREHRDFPAPYIMRNKGDGLPVWSMPEVLAWLAGRPRDLTERHRARGGARRRAA